MLECHGKSFHDRNITANFASFFKDKGEVVYKKVAVIVAIFDVNGVAEDTISGWSADVEEPVAEPPLWNYVLGEGVKVEQGRR